MTLIFLSNFNSLPSYHHSSGPLLQAFAAGCSQLLLSIISTPSTSLTQELINIFILSSFFAVILWNTQPPIIIYCSHGVLISSLHWHRFNNSTKTTRTDMKRLEWYVYTSGWNTRISIQSHLFPFFILPTPPPPYTFTSSLIHPIAG